MRPAPWLYAHRGAPAERPENTLPSFRLGLDLGADVLELDCHRTVDGHVVVSHDPDGARMAGVPTAIRDATVADVQGWDVGRGFVGPDGERPFARQGYRIPTLEEVLAGFPGVPLNIDVKQREPDMTGTIVELLRRHRATERVLLASFHDVTLRRVRALGYEGPTSLGQGETAALLFLPPLLYRRLGPRAQRAQLPTRWNGLPFAHPWVIARCHKVGLRADYWTVNDPAEAKLLLERGADGVMTDDPRRIAPVVQAFRDSGNRGATTQVS